MVVYILISVITAFWIWYPTLKENDLPEEDQMETVEWVFAFVLTAIIWPWFLIEYIIKLFKQRKTMTIPEAIVACCAIIGGTVVITTLFYLCLK